MHFDLSFPIKLKNHPKNLIENKTKNEKNKKVFFDVKLQPLLYG